MDTHYTYLRVIQIIFISLFLTQPPSHLPMCCFKIKMAEGDKIQTWLLKQKQSSIKKVIGLKDLDYNERLKTLTLKYLYMNEVYKILDNKYDPLTITTLSLLTRFDNHSSATCGHDSKLTNKTTNTRLCQHFFTNIVIKLWNNLPGDTVIADSLNAFKK